MNDVVIAERLAREAHAGQKGKYRDAERDYIEHVARVVALVEGEQAKAVAWLHDVIEDTPVTANDLTRAGISDEVREAVERLTHDKTAESYADYIDVIRVCGPELARVVKIADLKDHLRPGCPNHLRPRYERALASLSPAFPAVQGETCPTCGGDGEINGIETNGPCGWMSDGPCPTCRPQRATVQGEGRPSASAVTPLKHDHRFYRDAKNKGFVCACGDRIHDYQIADLQQGEPPAASPAPRTEGEGRLHALAKVFARRVHCGHVPDSEALAGSGVHVINREAWDFGFTTCTHPDCALVQDTEPHQQTFRERVEAFLAQRAGRDGNGHVRAYTYSEVLHLLEDFVREPAAPTPEEYICPHCLRILKFHEWNGSICPSCDHILAARSRRKDVDR